MSFPSINYQTSLSAKTQKTAAPAGTQQLTSDPTVAPLICVFVCISLNIVFFGGSSHLAS